MTTVWFNRADQFEVEPLLLYESDAPFTQSPLSFL